MEETRRCLFPATTEANDDASFDYELLNSEEIIKATHPDSSVEEATEETHSRKLPFRDSPVGVTELFPSAWHSTTVHVDENGAEVTLGFETISLQTPERRRHRAFQGLSLMDLGTPTPPPMKPKPTFANVWCGTSSTNCTVDDSSTSTGSAYRCYELPSAKSIQDIIADFLGGDRESMRWNGCSVWQECAFSVDSETQTTQYSDATHVDSGRFAPLRLRTFSLKTRQTRIHQMRRDLSPFAKSPARTPTIGRARSFSGADPHVPAIVRQSTTETRQGAAVRSAGTWLCTLPENALSESPLVQGYNRSEYPQDVGYDSDPEDFARCRSPKRARHNHRIQQSMAFHNTADYSSLLDQSIVIQEFMNQSFTLIYHPSSRDDRATQQGASCPIAMDAWLERGQILQEIIQPKWLFRPKSRHVYRKGSLVNKQAIKSIGLLDVTRILEIPVVDRTVHPFAKPFNSFVLRDVNDDEFCFEAQSTEECALIVFSLKLAIARFGAMVITSNNQVYEEFFASKENHIHDEEPEERSLDLDDSLDSYEC